MTKNFRKSLSLLLAVITLLTSFSMGLVVSAVGKVASLESTAVTETAIALSWSKVKDADGYRLYKYNYTSKKWQTLKTTTANSFTDKNLAKGSLNAYTVRAIEVVDGKYVYGDRSANLKVLTLPGSVGTLKAKDVEMNQLTLTWSKAEGAKGYAVYQYNPSTKKYSLIATPTATSYTVKNLKASTSYRFAVRAYVKDGYVAYGKTSNKLEVKTTDFSLGKVNNLQLDAFNEKAYRLKWDAVSGAEGYQVAIFDTATNKWKSVGRTVKTTATITAKDPEATYTYKVRAYIKKADGYIYGSFSETADAFAKPATPTGLEGAENSSRGISLRWNKIEGASGYEIYSYDATKGDWVYEGQATKNTYNVTGLSQTSHYTYKVRACKISGGKRYYGDFCESVTVNYHGSSSDSIYSEQMAASGVFGYLYDPAEKCFYTSDDPWQRNVGYNSIFDTAAPMALMGFDTVRLRFEYQDKDWMIQLWKGQYGLIFYGAEIGVYTKPKDRVLMHYDCASDADMLKMSMTFRENKSGQWVEKFTRPYGYYWWCTGFLPGNIAGKYETLSLDVRITAKDYDMLGKIKDCLDANSISYTASGLDVYFIYY